MSSISWCDSSVLSSGWSYSGTVYRMNDDRKYYTDLTEVSAVRVGPGTYKFNVALGGAPGQQKTQ